MREPRTGTINGMDWHRMRAADADRERVATQLKRGHHDGRLTLDELEERLQRTFAARTYGDLWCVTADLPAPAATAPAPAVRSGGNAMWVGLAVAGPILLAVGIASASAMPWVLFAIGIALVSALFALVFAALPIVGIAAAVYAVVRAVQGPRRLPGPPPGPPGGWYPRPFP